MNVPVVAELLTLKVRALVVVAGFVPNEAVVPLPMPLAESVTAAVKPPEGRIVMVLEPREPRLTVRLVGEADKLKLPDVEEFTVSRIVVELFRLPETPVMVTVTVPVAAVLLAVNVRRLVDVAGFVPNVAVTPDGRPEADSVTLPAKPLTGLTVIVVLPEPPRVTVMLAGEADKLKFAVAEASALINPLPFGLPQPVARS